MLIFLNSRFVPEEQAVVSVFDRSFLYGDGLFETLRVFNGKPFRWAQHMERLQRGAEFLGIEPPFPPDTLRSFADQLIARNQTPDALLRLTLSRGVGVRGCSPKGADHPTLVMSLHPAPRLFHRGESTSTDDFERHPLTPSLSPAGSGGEGVRTQWKLIVSSYRLPAGEPLAQFKTCNKLPQILARAEADAAGADEALLLNTAGFVVEGSTSNLFWVEGDTICTPPLAGGILAGVTRAVVMEICKSLGLEFCERNTTADALKRANGVFLTVSSWGVVEARSLDGHVLQQSPLVERIRLAYLDLVCAETA